MRYLLRTLVSLVALTAVARADHAAGTYLALTPTTTTCTPSATRVCLRYDSVALQLKLKTTGGENALAFAGGLGNWTFTGNMASLSSAGTMELDSPVLGSSGQNDAFYFRAIQDLTASGGEWHEVHTNRVGGTDLTVYEMIGLNGQTIFQLRDGSSASRPLYSLTATYTNLIEHGYDPPSSPDLAGGDVTFRGGLGRGAGLTGTIHFQYAPPGSSGTTQEVPVDGTVIDGATGFILKYQGSALVPSPWTAPSFNNGFVNYGAPYSNVGYYQDATGMVHLHGWAKSGTAGTSVFTLPVKLRPTSDNTCFETIDNSFGRVVIHANGDVQDYFSAGGNANISFDNCSFFAEQ